MRKHVFKIILSVILVTWFYWVFPQELNLVQQKFFEDIVEEIVNRTTEETDISQLIATLLFYRNNPLNINEANSEQLEELQILNAFQIAVIIDYRKKSGNIKSIHELSYLPGFRQQDVELLKGFISFSEPDQKIQINDKLLKNSDHQLILRYQRILEKQKGFKSLPDSILNSDPDRSRYLGSPDKLYLRYKGSFGRIFETGIIMEKDPGEEFFSGSNRHGFDFYSAYISYNNKQGLLRNITLGDYLVRWGQGLLIWNGYSFGKSFYTSSLSRRTMGTRGNLSADENRFLRGASITLGMGRFGYTAFYSGKRIDANIADTSIGKDIFTGFSETGYHSTPADIRKEKSLQQSTLGSSIRYNGNRFKIGLNAYFMSMNKSLANSEDLYKTQLFSGSELSGISSDYLFLAGKTQAFGETAYSNSSLASMNGILLMPVPEIQIGIIHRYYQEGYYSHYANAFSENSNICNENGLFLGGEFQYADFHLRIYGDIFSFPWLKYRVNAPS